MSAPFITFEGGEGAGKSTQIKRLNRWLRRRGIETVATREPGGTSAGEALRTVLLEGIAAPFGPEAEALLFAVSRRDHVIRLIRPALERGAWVLCDRFIDSTRAYQGGVVMPDTLRRLEEIALDGLYPDLTFVLDLPVEVGLKRAKARDGGEADRFEGDAKSIHAERRERYHAIARDEPDRVVVIGSERPADIVAAEIRRIVAERFSVGVRR